MPIISLIHARQILDSRSNPTVEVEVTLSDGSFGRASVPSGASTGMYEAIELRDMNSHHFNGKSVEQAVGFVNGELSRGLQDNDPFDQLSLDQEMVLRDGTDNAGRLGANAILGVSLAVSKAAANSLHIPYYQYIRQLFQQICTSLPSTSTSKLSLPIPMFNVLNGGAHTQWQSTDCQEFMIVPHAATTFHDQLEWGSEIYHALSEILKKKGHQVTIGDEGGFAPTITDQEAIEVVLMAIESAGFQPGKQVSIALDPASSEWAVDGGYHLRLQKKHYTSEEMVAHWQQLVAEYPIYSLEDGLAENDWDGWQLLKEKVSDKVILVGDDLLVTNVERIQKAIQLDCCTALLMKVNQIGTLTQSLQAICTARQAGWKIIVSHRSGETEDASIADIAVGTGAQLIKSGAPARSERLAKYNQLLRIEEEIG